jgi:hypothetical protein
MNATVTGRRSTGAAAPRVASGRLLAAVGDRAEAAPVAERETETLEIEVGQLEGVLEVDLFTPQGFEVPLEAEAREPPFEVHRAPLRPHPPARLWHKAARQRRGRRQETLTPFQNATRPLISLAASLGSG